MLQTTVAYLSLLENKRHNLITEDQGYQQLDINRDTLAETTRHNKASENLGWATLAETSRHNTVVEGINAFDAETRRSALDIQWYNADTQRYSAVQSAGIGWANVAVGQQNADTSLMRANNDYEIASKTAEINQMNAETNALNAATRQEELAQKKWNDVMNYSNQSKQAEASVTQAQTRSNEYDLEAEKQEYEIRWGNAHLWHEASDIINNTVRTATGGFHSIWNMLPGLGSN